MKRQKNKMKRRNGGRGKWVGDKKVARWMGKKLRWK